MNDLLTRLSEHMVNHGITRRGGMVTVYADKDRITGLRWTFALFEGHWWITTLTGNPAGDDFSIVDELRPATTEESAWVESVQ